jgi:hypothetical protein
LRLSITLGCFASQPSMESRINRVVAACSMIARCCVERREPAEIVGESTHQAASALRTRVRRSIVRHRACERHASARRRRVFGRYHCRADRSDWPISATANLIPPVVASWSQRRPYSWNCVYFLAVQDTLSRAPRSSAFLPSATALVPCPYMVHRGWGEEKTKCRCPLASHLLRLRNWRARK